MGAPMRRVAGRRRRRPDPSGELAYMRHYAPNDGTTTPEALRLMGEALAQQTGRLWCVARENDLYLRMYLLPIGLRRGR